MAFDVEKTMSPVPPGGFSSSTRRAIKSINLMCFLLDDVTFGEFYTTDFRGPLTKMLNRANALSDPIHRLGSLNQGAYTGNDIQPLLVGALQDILNSLNRPVFLSGLFAYVYPAGSIERGIADRFRTMYNDATDRTTGNNDLEHFCCPVVAFQERTLPPLNPIDPLTNLLSSFGDMTLYDLFTRPRKRLTALQQTHLNDAREAGILVDRTVKFAPARIEDSPEINLMYFPPANELRCNWSAGVCITGDTTTFCNDANGACSIMSYP